MKTDERLSRLIGHSSYLKVFIRSVMLFFYLRTHSKSGRDDKVLSLESTRSTRSTWSRSTRSTWFTKSTWSTWSIWSRSIPDPRLELELVDTHEHFLGVTTDTVTELVFVPFKPTLVDLIGSTQESRSSSKPLTIAE